MFYCRKMRPLMMMQSIMLVTTTISSRSRMQTVMSKCSFTSKGTSKKKINTGTTSMGPPAITTTTIPLVKKKGCCAVDPNAPTEMLQNACVYEDANDNIYSVKLNQTDISHGLNHNKFYSLQLLEHNTKKTFHVFASWGRVGAKGGSQLMSFDSLDAAKKEFDKKFHAKSGNKFDERTNFVIRRGKYTLVDVDYENDGSTEDAAEKQKKVLEAVSTSPKKPSKLDVRVQNLVKLIFNLEMMQDTLVKMEFDINKMPLGKLKKAHILKGYEVLKNIDIALRLDPSRLLDLTNQFYSLIPHDFGRNRPPLIRSHEHLMKKLAMLEALGDIEIATSLLKGTNLSDENPLDVNYHALNTSLVPIEPASKEYRTILQYLRNTHAPAHTKYKIKLRTLFAVKRQGEDLRYEEFKNLHNRQLLWHGSRLSNFVGILSQGLRIAPPEAPSTGYMFGKGVYFADMVTKSANYCHAGHSNRVALLLLSEVALGNTYDCLHGEFMNEAKQGFHSTKGLGATIPDPAQNAIINGVVLPMGKPIPSGVVGAHLLHNEFIVYDIRQVFN